MTLRPIHVEEDEDVLTTVYEILDEQGNPVYNNDGTPQTTTHSIRSASSRTDLGATLRGSMPMASEE